jgi:integrase/recombinase XerD
MQHIEMEVSSQNKHSSLISSFVHFLEARGCSPNTVKSYLQDLKSLFAFISLAGITLENFGAKDLIGFITFLNNRKRGAGGRNASTPALVSDRLAPATINRVLVDRI